MNNPTYVARSMDSLIDIIETDVFCLDGKVIHCTFPFEENDRWLRGYFDKAWSKGVVKVTFSNSKTLYSTFPCRS
ncbi:hypothetical protein [Vibrio crassostreae]|uniref:hypothetical protein n=1 Tax=Vibrio crassostreae TaxID=246167 RepID=UPI001B310AAB|nr:hypothetical protein [Vibrio crassostreae]